MRLHSKDWTGVSWYEYVRSSIMWNQIILKLLLENKHIAHFNIQFLYSDEVYVQTKLYVPLMVGIKDKTYIFEFIRGFPRGKCSLEEKYIKWGNCPEIYGGRVNLVFLCENEYHMETMAMYFGNLTNENKVPIYFTHDELWFGENKKKLKVWCNEERRLKVCKFN